jgi:hypothetical protein
MPWSIDMTWKSEVLVEFAKLEVQPTLYTYNELRVATRDFHSDNELGKGSFGVVYKVNILHIHFIPSLYIFTISRYNNFKSLIACVLSFVVQLLHGYWFLLFFY